MQIYGGDAAWIEFDLQSIREAMREEDDVKHDFSAFLSKRIVMLNGMNVLQRKRARY